MIELFQPLQVQCYMRKKGSSSFLSMLQSEASQIHQEADELKSAKNKGQAKAVLKAQQQAPTSIHPATIQDLHQQCQQRIQHLEQLYNDANKQLLASNEQNQKMKNSLEAVETKAKAKTLELARLDGIYRSQVEKTLKAREQVGKLTANLRATSSLLKNALTAYHTMQRVQQSADTHQRDAMSKLIRHYQRELYPHEALPGDELDVRKLVKLTEEQQADIDGLLSKLLQREEEANNAKAINQEILRQLREDTVFQQDLCAKIEESLATSVNIDRDLYKRCQQLANQNQELRLRNQELEKGRTREHAFESSIRYYEQELKKLLEALRKKSVEEVECTELLGERELLRKQLQWYQDQLGTLKINEAKHQELVDHLLHDNEEGEKERTRLDQQLEVSERKTKSLKRQLDQLKRQWHSEIHPPALSEPSLAQTLPSQMPPKESILEPLLVTSEILQRREMSLRVQVAEQLRKAYGRVKIRSSLLFRHDKYHWNFGPYLEGRFDILLLMTIDSSRMISAFACNPGITDSTSSSSIHTHLKAFLGCCDGEGWEWVVQRNQEFKKLRAVRFWEGNLIFGNNQLIVRNNSSEREAVLNTNIFGATFFEKLTMHVLPNDSGPAFQYNQLEIHKIELQ